MFFLVREVHAYCGLLLLLFIVMYAVTGFPLMHTDRFSLEAEAAVTAVALDFAGDPDSDELFDYLASEFDVRGQRLPMETEADGSRSLMFERPGWTVRFLVAPDLRTATRFEREGSFFQKSVDLHNLKGFHGGLANAVWGVVLDLVSLAMIVFAVTGVYLWYVRKKDRRLGWALLGASWGLWFAVLAFLLLTP